LIFLIREREKHGRGDPSRTLTKIARSAYSSSAGLCEETAQLVAIVTAQLVAVAREEKEEATGGSRSSGKKTCASGRGVTYLHSLLVMLP
jgi:hypothetical protein